MAKKRKELLNDAISGTKVAQRITETRDQMIKRRKAKAGAFQASQVTEPEFKRPTERGVIEKPVDGSGPKLAKMRKKKAPKRTQKVGFDRSKMSKEELRRDTAKFRRMMNKKMNKQ